MKTTITSIISNSMKSNFCFISLCLLMLGTGCQEKEIKTFSYLHSLADSLPVDKDKNIIIYTINQNDCINCLYGFSAVENKLTHTLNSKIFVIRVNREIEKNELLKTTKSISLKDSTNKVVLWDKKIFDRISKITRHTIPVSLLIVYNYKTDSILYQKSIKEMTDTEELKAFINK
jgi:hypothetical protein